MGGARTAFSSRTPGRVLWDASWQVLRLSVGSWLRSGPVSTAARDSLRTWWLWHLEVVICLSCPDPLCPPESATGSRACPSKLGPDAPVPTCPGCSNSWIHTARLEGGGAAARPADFPCPGQRPLPALHSGPCHRGPPAGWLERTGLCLEPADQGFPPGPSWPADPHRGGLGFLVWARGEFRV